MARVEYEGITFDSEWEKDYYIYLKEELKADFIKYHPEPIFDLVARKKYTPDFIYQTNNTISVVEVKGSYNPYANHFQDDMIHKEMKAKNYRWLYNYFWKNGIKFTHSEDGYYDLKYEKVKKLKKGWVDYDFKNPNTIANKRKEKINDLSTEIKALRDFKKDAERYFRYHIKVVQNEKLTKPQKEWYYNYVKKLREEYGNNEPSR
jgi:hypothetical protein